MTIISSPPVPKLVCPVADNAGGFIGLIESCLEGAPLSRFEGGVNDRSRLEVSLPKWPHESVSYLQHYGPCY